MYSAPFISLGWNGVFSTSLSNLSNRSSKEDLDPGSGATVAGAQTPTLLSFWHHDPPGLGDGATTPSTKSISLNKESQSVNGRVIIFYFSSIDSMPCQNVERNDPIPADIRYVASTFIFFYFPFISNIWVFYYSSAPTLSLLGWVSLLFLGRAKNCICKLAFYIRWSRSCRRQSLS